jgi:hypothetical protein
MPSRDDDDDDRPPPRRRDRDDDDDDRDRPRRRRRDDDDDDYDPRPAAAVASNAAGLTLSIVGLVFGTLALLFSFIPCIGALALWPGIVALVLSGIGLFVSVRAKALPITAVAVSALSIGFALWQQARVDKVIDKGKEAIETMTEKAQQELDRQRERDRLERERLDKLKNKTN